jgi:hypothetical protein
MNLSDEMIRAIDERVEKLLQERIEHFDSKTTLYTSSEAAMKLRIPIAGFNKLAKGIPVVKLGEDRRKNRYTLFDLKELVERHKLQPMA